MANNNNNIIQINYIDNIDYPEYNIYIFKKKCNELYIGIYKLLKDFHFLQKNKIFTLHHSGLQELYKQKLNFDLDISKLKERINKIN